MGEVHDLGVTSADDSLLFFAADNNTLIVWCDVVEGTNYSESFHELLAKQNISWAVEAEIAEGEALRSLASKAKIAPDGTTTKDTSDQSALGLGRKAPQKRLADAEQAALDSNNEVVLVEAGETQIEAILAAIDGAANVFVKVDVEPAPDAPQTQRQLQRFARGQGPARKLSEELDEKTKEGKKRDETPLASAAGPAAGEAKQNQASAGVARRLGVRPEPLSDEMPKGGARKESLPELAQSRAKREDSARMKKPAPAFAFGAGGRNQLAADKERFQVLFVLHPVETEGRPAAAEPATAKPPNAKPSNKSD